MPRRLARRRARVLLPTPDGPSIATTSGRAATSLNVCRAARRSLPGGDLAKDHGRAAARADRALRAWRPTRRRAPDAGWACCAPSAPVRRLLWTRCRPTPDPRIRRARPERERPGADAGAWRGAWAPERAPCRAWARWPPAATSRPPAG